jgi:hypothetical protein
MQTPLVGSQRSTARHTKQITQAASTCMHPPLHHASGCKLSKQRAISSTRSPHRGQSGQHHRKIKSRTRRCPQS